MYLLYILSLFLSFQFALNLAPGFDVSVLRVIVPVFFMGVILKSLYKRDFFIPCNLQSICLAGFFLINIFSLFFAQNLEFGIRKILFLGSIFPLYFVVYYLLQPSSRHSRESGDLDPSQIWIPAFAGMTKWLAGMTREFVCYFILGGFLVSVIALIIFFSQFIVGIDGILNFYGKIGPFFWGQSFSQSVLEYQSFLVNVGGIDFIRAAGLFPDPHNFALFSGIILFLSLFLAAYYLKEKNKYQAFFYSATSLIIASALLLSFSRGAYLAAIGASAVVFILVKVCHPPYQVRGLPRPVSQYGVNSNGDPDNCHCEARSNLRIPIFARMTKWVAGMTILGLIFLLPPVKNRFLDTFSMEDGSNIGRIQIMKDGFILFKNNFLFGVGIGNAPLYYNENIDYRNPTNSHNTYLEIAIENGIAGIAVWLVLIFGTIFQLIKYLKFQKDDFFWYLAIGLAGALAFFAVHSFFEVFLYSPINLAALMILLALSSKIIILSPKT